MAALTLNGFSVRVQRGGKSGGSTVLGAVERAIDGTPGGGITAEVEEFSVNLTLSSLAEARAVQELCRHSNGIHWACDNSVYGSEGTALTETPTFQTGTKKFGTHAISIATGAGAGDIDVITTSSVAFTVAAWTKDGAGAWTHYIQRSDGAKWVGAVRNDSATPIWTVSAGSAWTLDQDATNIRYFDDLVYMPFLIDDDWGAEWVQDAAFYDLGGHLVRLEGDLIGTGYYVDARINAERIDEGQAHTGGSTQNSARVSLDVVGGERGIS